MLPRSDYQTVKRMDKKREAIPLPPLKGKAVLDVGCDGGYWTRLASDMGASEAVGIDRNRDVKGLGLVDLVAENRALAYPRCRFERSNVGREWLDFGRFDVAFCFSVYHHIYENCGSHVAVWYWLASQLKPGGLLLWESPLDDRDGVIQANVSAENRRSYTQHEILDAASIYFHIKYYGPAKHAPHRHVYQCIKRNVECVPYTARVSEGAGGATHAFAFAHGRRIAEIEAILGMRAVPGSLNLKGSGGFDWSQNYLRARLLDVTDRKAGLNSEWAERWCRFYPLEVKSDSATAHAYAMRFEGESYRDSLVELIAPHSLRRVLDVNTGDKVTLWSR